MEIEHSCQTNAKYNIRQITNTITNTKYQTTNKCQTDDLLPEYLHQGQERMIIKGNPTIPEQFENQNIPVQLSSNHQHRNADKNVNVRNSRATIISHPQFRMTREREPSRISYKMVTRLSNGKKKN